MKGCSNVVAACGLIIQAAAALDPALHFVTVVHKTNIAVRQLNDIRIAAVVPTESGQIGINPPGHEPTPANIGGHTKFLKLEGGTTTWIGTDPSNIAIKVTTATYKSGATAVATITKGVSALKEADGGLNILLGPKVKAKLEAIAKQVKSCTTRRGRRSRKRGEPACGLADFVQRVGADEELQSEFAQPLTDQVFDEIDEGYHGDPATDHGWEGDGGHHPVNEDEGYFSDNGEGLFQGVEGAEGSAAGDTLEGVVFSSAEEAALVAAALSANEIEAAGIYGGSTVTAGSFLAFIWNTLRDGKPLANANKVPNESIHKITVTKTTSRASSSTAQCPKATGAPPECDKCKPTSVKADGAKATGVFNWACSEGSTKGCPCDPQFKDHDTFATVKFNQAISQALDDLTKEPKESETLCDGKVSDVSSEFLADKTANSFCADVMKNPNNNAGSTAYDIDGNKIPLLKLAKVDGSLTPRRLAPQEKPDNYKDYKFFLNYKHEEGNCRLPKEDLCKNAYRKLVSSKCGSNRGNALNRLYVDATIDTGCGEFSWHVDAPPLEETPPPPPPAKPTLGPRVCHDAHKHQDVQKAWVDTWSLFGCKLSEKMKAGDKEIYWHPVGGEYEQNYKISWIEGCTVAQEQSVEHPIEDDQSIYCGDLFKLNYYNCNNGGAGGTIDAGCLRYDFYAT